MFNPNCSLLTPLLDNPNLATIGKRCLFFITLFEVLASKALKSSFVLVLEDRLVANGSGMHEAKLVLGIKDQK
jgi:hypothetical protein